MTAHAPYAGPPVATRDLHRTSRLLAQLALTSGGGALLTWVWMGAVPATTAQTSLFVVFVVFAFLSALGSLVAWLELDPVDRDGDWLPLTAALSSFVLVAIVLAFYLSGAATF